MAIRRICAWCHKHLAGPMEDAADNAPISHGMCEECSEFFLSNEPQGLKEFLDRFSQPIVCVNGAGVTIAINNAAAKTLGVDPRQASGLLGGDLMQCRHARLPGGCGKTTCCTGCTIRQAVEATAAQGHRQVRALAYLERQLGTAAPVRYQLRISTERIGSAVLLRIDELGEVPSS